MTAKSRSVSPALATTDDWEVVEETPLAATGLKVQQVPIEAVQQALQDPNNTEADLGNVDLGRWQPDFILVSWKRKRIAVVDLTRPSDVLSAQLEEAYRSKKRKCCPVRSALHHYIREGWTIEILPWVIGIRGLTDTASLQKVSFLDIPQQKWRDIIDDSVLASVKALAYMHKVQYSSNNRQPTMDKVDQPVANTRTGRKRR